MADKQNNNSGNQYSSGDIYRGGSHLVDGVFAYIGSRQQAAALKGDARQVEVQALAEANDRARDGRAGIAAGAAIAGASGLTLEGSATDVLAFMAQEAETSSARARYDGYIEAKRLRHQAKLKKQAGNFALISGIFKAASSLGG